MIVNVVMIVSATIISVATISSVVIAAMRETIRLQTIVRPVTIITLVIIGISLAGDPGQLFAQDKGVSSRGRNEAGSVDKSPAGQTDPGGSRTSGDRSRLTQSVTREGVTVEFTIEPVPREQERTEEKTRERTVKLLEGTEATVQFKISDTRAGKALSSLRPAAWVDLRRTDQPPDPRECREKVQSFLQANFNHRPDIDLNSYFVLALNREPNISVIDPLSGFGNSKLYTLVPLASPGEDWVISADKKRLYVSLPLVNQVAAIDTATWKTIANIDAGTKPTSIALQHDGKYLWVGDDGADEGASGVTVVDTTTLKVVAQIKTGSGHHEFAFTDDDSHAFVTNQLSGTLSVIDVRKLLLVTNIPVGSRPTALAFSPLGKTVYVANEGDGSIVVVDGAGQRIVARIKTQPGLRAIRILPDGRFGFVVNRILNTVDIFDVSTSRLLSTVPVGPLPDQITFTREFAYVRSAASEFVTMIKISELGSEGHEVAVTRFPAGQKVPQEPSSASVAEAIIPAPEEGAVLVANSADQMIYFYTEGMAAPMGSFQNYRRSPKAVLVLDNSLRETTPGTYATTVRLGKVGRYDVAFLLDSPRLVNCFDITVAENAELPKQKALAINVEPFLKDGAVRVGEPYRLRFKVTDSSSNRPQTDLKDMGVLVFLAPGVWQQREWAKPLGSGLYEMSFVPPQAGIYYVYFQCPSLGARFNQIPYSILRATTDNPMKAK